MPFLVAIKTGFFGEGHPVADQLRNELRRSPVRRKAPVIQCLPPSKKSGASASFPQDKVIVIFMCAQSGKRGDDLTHRDIFYA